VLDRLTLRSAHPAPSLLLFRPIPVLSLLVHASESRHHSLALSLSRYTGTSSVMHLSYSLLYLDSLILSLLLLIRVPLAQLHTHPSSSRSHPFYFLIGLPVLPAVLLSLLLFLVLFIFSITLGQYPALFPFAHSVLALCRSPLPLSLSACSSCTLPSLCTPVFLCPLLASIQNLSLALSPPALVPPSPDLCPVHQHALFHALKHRHSPPELTSPLSLSYSSAEIGSFAETFS
jgi:hypothetical protein